MVNFVAAGVWALLGAAAGLAAIRAVQQHREQLKTDGDGGEVISSGTDSPAAAFVFRAGSVTLGEWTLILLAAALVGAAAFRLQSRSLPVLQSGRLLLTAVLMAYAMVVDRYTHRIPNKLVLVMLIAGAVLLVPDFFFRRDMFKDQLTTSVVGLLAMLVFFYIMARLTRGGIGMGDVKLLAAQGWMTGVYITLLGTVLSLMACSVAAIGLLALKKKTKQDQVPFGPFLFFGYTIALLICNL